MDRRPGLPHPITLAHTALHILPITALLLFGSYLLSFADHARQMLGFAYPLDYGEGPLLAQVSRLLSGTPIWRLYADPAAPPFIIVNYPPTYLLFTAALTPIFGSPLIAGRAIGLLSALGSVVALTLLGNVATDRRATTRLPSTATLAALLFLTIPIVREWAALMRVDMLGVCLGLWGLVALRRGGPGAPILAGGLILASLCTKPSLLAAPLAAGIWLLWCMFRPLASAQRNAVRDLISFSTVVGFGGLFCIGVLQWASNGWFWLHVVTANANRWEAELARAFWVDQARLRWPLAVLAGLAVWQIWRIKGPTAAPHRLPHTILLPLTYTLGGIITAIGVGKVGAYSNYFLEFYAGLIWLIVLGAHALPLPSAPLQRAHVPIWLLLVAALAYYPPLWDPERLRPAGLIEPSPPRLAFGSHGLWVDSQRETAVLAALTRVHGALVPEVQAAAPQIFTDLPGVAAAANVGSRLQVFEARQLLDQGLADATDLHVELANGSLPLAVIDYLGNWLTPTVVELLQRRYAHDGTLGTFHLFRPVDPGPVMPLPTDHTGPLMLSAYKLAAPLSAAYEPGELLTLALLWQRPDQVHSIPATELSVNVGLLDSTGRAHATDNRLLLYGVLPPAGWPSTPIEHLQPFHLPEATPSGTYTLAAQLAAGNHPVGPLIPLTTVTVAPSGGRMFAATGYFVPAPLIAAWNKLGGMDRVGLPLTPLIPFAWGRLQCFEYTCLELRDGQVQQRELGNQLYLAETHRSSPCANGLCPGFAAVPYAEPGNALSGEHLRNGWLVQWTTTARLERDRSGGPINLGRLGDDALHLPPGMRYRWP